MTPLLNARHFTIAALYLLLASPVALANNPAWDAITQSASAHEVLPPHEAFPMSAWHDQDTLFISAAPQAGYYLYRDNFTFRWESSQLSEEAASSMLAGPEGKLIDDPFFGETYTYHDDVIFSAPLPAGGVEGPLQVTYQGCAEVGICYPIETTTLAISYRETWPHHLRDIPLSMGHQWPIQAFGRSDSPVTDEKFPHAEKNGSEPPQVASLSGLQDTLANASPLLLFAILLAAGLGLTFTPCVLPMLPILSAILVRNSASQGRAFAASTSYVMGMVASYTTMGVTIGLMGSRLNLQATLQSPIVLPSFASVFILLGLAMGGYLAPTLPQASAVKNAITRLQDKLTALNLPGIAGAGALSVLVVSPCISAPLAGILLFISSSGDAWTGGVALMGLSVGMGLPLIVIGTVGGRWLPKAGPWLDAVKRVFAFGLAGVGVWLLGRVLPGQVAVMLWGLFALAITLSMMPEGPWRSKLGRLLGSVTVPLMLGALAHDSAIVTRISLVVVSLVVALEIGLLIYRRQITSPAPVIPLIFASLWLFSAALGATDPLRPLAVMEERTALAGSTEPRLTVTEQGALVSAASESTKPVLAVFTADWCPSCKVMERHLAALSEQSVLDDVTLLYVDITQQSAEARELLEEHKLFGPPAITFYSGATYLENYTLAGESSEALLRQRITDVREHLKKRFKGI